LCFSVIINYAEIQSKAVYSMNSQKILVSMSHTKLRNTNEYCMIFVIKSLALVWRKILYQQIIVLLMYLNFWY